MGSATFMMSVPTTPEPSSTATATSAAASSAAGLMFMGMVGMVDIITGRESRVMIVEGVASTRCPGEEVLRAANHGGVRLVERSIAS